MAEGRGTSHSNRRRIAIGGGAITLVGVASALVTIADSRTVREVFFGLPSVETSNAPGSDRSEAPKRASGNSLSANPVVIATPKASARVPVVIEATGNSASRAVATDISSDLRRTISTLVREPVGRITVMLTNVSFSGSSRTASLGWQIESQGLKGECTDIEIQFGTNSELARRAAEAVAQSVNESIDGGTLVCV